MVTGEKIISNIVFRYRLGTILIWSGVLIWLPFIFLRAIGERPSFLLFLPIHLLGVIGGSRLRAEARKDLDRSLPKKNVMNLIGYGMILLGILAWAPYLYLKLVVAQPVEVLTYLPYHLAGIFGGVCLYFLGYLREHLAKS